MTFKEGNIPWNKGKKGVQIPWNKGIPRSDETKRRISLSHKDKKLSDSHRKSISDTLKGQIPWNKGLTKEIDDRVRKQSDSLNGFKHNDKTRKQMSISHTGLLQPEKVRQKISKSQFGVNNSFYGRVHSDYNKQKWSEEKTGDGNPMFGKNGKNSPNWKGGVSFDPYCYKFNNNFKERVREYFNRHCFICNKREEDLGYKLDIHHVNYDKMTCCNDIKPLFVPLCRSCHMKTNGDREYWEEFFTVSLEFLTNGECY